VAAGANAIKWQSYSTPVLIGGLSQATFNARIAQFIAYCQTQGLGVYWCLQDSFEPSETHGDAAQAVHNVYLTDHRLLRKRDRHRPVNEGIAQFGIPTIVTWLQTYLPVPR
jgi:hypothetical protein